MAFHTVIIPLPGVTTAFNLPVTMQYFTVTMLDQADAFAAESPKTQQTHSHQENTDQQFRKMGKRFGNTDAKSEQ